MADAPEWLTLTRHRDLVGRERHPETRWILLGLGAVGALAAREEIANATLVLDPGWPLPK